MKIRKYSNKINIIPGDPGWFGKYIRLNVWNDGVFGMVLCVGKKKIFLRMSNGDEESYLINQSINGSYWELFAIIKKPKIVRNAILY